MTTAPGIEPRTLIGAITALLLLSVLIVLAFAPGSAVGPLMAERLRHGCERIHLVLAVTSDGLPMAEHGAEDWCSTAGEDLSDRLAALPMGE